MEKDRSDILFSTAKELLLAAEHELERSDEDVVTHLVCTHSRLSLSNFLAGFLIRKQVPVHHPVSLVSLLEQCKELDSRFEQVNLNHVHCRDEKNDKVYCLDLHQVDQCFQAAQLAMDIVLTETPGY